MVPARALLLAAVLPALVTGQSWLTCSGTFSNADAATNFFSADCAAALVHGSRCALTLDSGYTGGSVMCDVAGSAGPAYIARPAGSTGSTNKLYVPVLKVDATDAFYLGAAAEVGAADARASPRGVLDVKPGA